MREDVYGQLANELDRIPNGFPRTESGVELKLLAKLFTEEEARMGSSMSLDPKTIHELVYHGVVKCLSIQKLFKTVVLTALK